MPDSNNSFYINDLYLRMCARATSQLSPDIDCRGMISLRELFSLLDGMKPIEFINRLESEMAKERGYGVYWKQFKTFPQLVLAFVMQHVHSLRWNDDQDDWKPYSPTRDTPYKDDS